MAQTADVVVIGSGGFGSSVAYAVARRRKAVILLDRHAIASQTSPRAAGLASTIRSTDLMTTLATIAADMFVQFQEETGQPMGVVRAGSIKVARTPEDAALLVGDAARGERLRLGTTPISAGEAHERHPLLQPDGIVAALHVPTDIYFEPGQAALSFAMAAAARGATLMPHNPVTAIRRVAGRVVGVDTPGGPIDAAVVVDAAGAWAQGIAELAGYRIPLAPMRHQLLITEPLPGVHAMLPMIRIIDAAVYVRPSWGGLLVGGYEDAPTHIDMNTVPAGFQVTDVPLDVAVLRGLIAKVARQLPILVDAPIRVHRGGVPTLTVDGQHIVGEVPGAEGMFVAAGCNVSGLSISPVIGELLAEWIVQGRPSIDLSPMAITRFGAEWDDDARVRAAADRHYASFYRATI